MDAPNTVFPDIRTTGYQAKPEAGYPVGYLAFMTTDTGTVYF
jgi:hypothetical protein